jgi:hypothetical protein
MIAASFVLAAAIQRITPWARFAWAAGPFGISIAVLMAATGLFGGLHPGRRHR